MRRSPRTTLFPYTTLFRSHQRGKKEEKNRADGENGAGGCHAAAPLDWMAWQPSGDAGAESADQRLFLLFLLFFVFLGFLDRKSTRLNSSHITISYAVFCLKDAAFTEDYTLSLHDALPISSAWKERRKEPRRRREWGGWVSCGSSSGLDGVAAERGCRCGKRRPEVISPLPPLLRLPRLFRSEEHTSELQSHHDLVCRLLLERCGVHRGLHSFPTRRSSDLISVERKKKRTAPTARMGRVGVMRQLLWIGWRGSRAGMPVRKAQTRGYFSSSSSSSSSSAF